MRIGYDRFIKMFGKDKHVGASVDRVERFWCDRMTMDGKCTNNCKLQCGPDLEIIIDRIRNAEPKSYVALLTWIIKDQYSKYADRKLEEKVIKYDPVGSYVDFTKIFD